MEQAESFEAERPRLTGIASRILGDHAEAEDVVQQAWLRLERTDTEIESLPAWLTTVTTRVCLDRLRARVPMPVEVIEDFDGSDGTTDPAEDVALADTVGLALRVVMARLSPRERVAFVLHDSFAVGFGTIAAILNTTPTSARKLASRARTKLAAPLVGDGHKTDWEVVDAFMAAATAGDFERLLSLLAPSVGVSADAAAILVGTPERMEGRQDVAAFFNGRAQSALSVYAGKRPGVAWYKRGAARVLFDFTIVDGLVQQVVFRAEPEMLARLVRRDGGARRSPSTSGNRQHLDTTPPQKE